MPQTLSFLPIQLLSLGPSSESVLLTSALPSWVALCCLLLRARSGTERTALKNPRLELS